MILSVEHGTFGYTKDRPVLKDISFSLEQGHVLAVLGPNGAGKTTLLKCITGMHRWTGGRTLLDGQDISRIPPRSLWQKIAYTPQAKSAPACRVSEAVLLGRSSRIGIFSTPSKEDRMAADSVLELLSISHLRDKKCNEISGGEFQMVLIARALAAEPSFLILDEPESNLDFRNQLRILQTISSLPLKGVSCIFNTHYPAHALQRADLSLLLDPSGEPLFGSTSSVITEENIRKAFGVNAVIGEVETDAGMLKSVLPVDTDVSSAVPDPAGRCIATVSVISGSNTVSEAVNSVLHTYRDLVIGRMGLPCRDGGVYLISLMVDGQRSAVDELTQRLGTIPGISVKTTYAKGSFSDKTSGKEY